MEGGATASSLFWVGDGFSRGVVVVAEFFLLQADAAAAVTVGEDMAALEAFWCVGCGFDDGVWHVSPHWVKSVQSLQKKGPEPVLRGQVFCFWRLNTKARLLAGPYFLSTSILPNGVKLNGTFGENIFGE
jgi:hypothetical protein